MESFPKVAFDGNQLESVYDETKNNIAHARKYLKNRQKGQSFFN